MKTIRLLILTTLSIGLLCTSCKKEEEPVVKEGELGLIYLDKNGVTIKAYNIAQAGDTDILDGVTYTVVDSAMLYTMVENGEDVTTVVTTLITNASYLFSGNNNFNQDISTWDMSNVNNMSGMFNHAESFNQDISYWDVSNVTNMGGMFNSNDSFNQDLSIWSVVNVSNCSGYSTNTTSWVLPKPNFTSCDCECN